MLFQALDNKRECVGVYHAGELYFEELPDNLTKTWSPSGLELDSVEYAHIYCGGKSMTDVCPENLKTKWKTNMEKIPSGASKVTQN